VIFEIEGIDASRRMDAGLGLAALTIGAPSARRC